MEQTHTQFVPEVGRGAARGGSAARRRARGAEPACVVALCRRDDASARERQGHWKPWFNTAGEAAAKAIGIGWDAVEYADTTSYQAAIRTSGQTSKVPDLYSWWSGWLMKEIVDADFAADVTPIWNKNAAYYSKGVRSAFTFGARRTARRCTSATGLCFTTSTSSRTRS